MEWHLLRMEAAIDVGVAVGDAVGVGVPPGAVARLFRLGVVVAVAIRLHPWMLVGVHVVGVGHSCSSYVHSVQLKPTSRTSPVSGFHSMCSIIVWKPNTWMVLLNADHSLRVNDVE